MTAMDELNGKVAVVTGGASGIGKGIAQALLGEGAQVVIADVEEEALRTTAQELDVVGIRTDVTSLESVEALAHDVVERFGTVHVACNNAGVGGMARIADLTIDDWRWILDVNLWGVIHGVHVFLPILKANADGGHVVNTASMAGLAAFPGLGSYTVTKFGVVGLTEVLAAELAEDGVKVGATVLCPGTIRTNIQRSARNRPPGSTGALADVDVSQPGGQVDMSGMRWMDPLDVGAIVVDAIKRGDLYAITHPEWWPMVQQRVERTAAAFGQRAELGA